MVATLVESTQAITLLFRKAVALAYHRRWWGILSTALQCIVSTSLLHHPGTGNMPGPGPEPPLGDLLEIAMEIPEVSRLPPLTIRWQRRDWRPEHEASDATIMRA